MSLRLEHRRGPCSAWCGVRAPVCCLICSVLLTVSAYPAVARSVPFNLQVVPPVAPLTAPAAQPGVPYNAQQLAGLLPPAVYFQGQTANLQLRNAGAVKFGSGAIAWVCLVDSSGYASDVQERYQFYLVTETRLRVGDAELPAGAYGGGFLKDRFLIMNLGGHTIAEGPVQTDATLQRPRPLQLQPDSSTSVKLFLGRRSVLLRADPAASTSQ